jgi:hypothetical protein
MNRRWWPKMAVRTRAWGGALVAALVWSGNPTWRGLPAMPLAHRPGLTARPNSATPTQGERARRVRAGAAPTYTLTVPTRDLVDLLRGQLFTDSGRFYPCRTNPQCSAWGQDIAVSSPNISIDGPRLIFSVHLVGSYAMAQFFTPTVAGDLVISGVPTVRTNRVVLTQSAVAAGQSSDMTFRAFLEAVHPRVEAMIDQSPGFDLAQYLSYSAADPYLPPPRLPHTTCVDPSQIEVQSVSTQPSASAISAIVAVSPPPPGKCSAH